MRHLRGTVLVERSHPSFPGSRSSLSTRRRSFRRSSRNRRSAPESAAFIAVRFRRLGESCARAAVYASPVFRMRARTRRLKSFWWSSSVSFGHTTGHSPAAHRGERKGPTKESGRSAPLCLALDSGWGGVSGGWARTGADWTLQNQVGGVKTVGGGGRSVYARRARRFQSVATTSAMAPP